MNKCLITASLKMAPAPLWKQKMKQENTLYGKKLLLLKTY